MKLGMVQMALMYAGDLVVQLEKGDHSRCARLAFHDRIRSSCMASGVRSPFTMPTATGKKARYAAITCTGPATAGSAASATATRCG